jgi:3-deoxy-D-manno-octulosonate 8-phosphate phosphatase (KDO 8-P phosphatase)
MVRIEEQKIPVDLRNKAKNIKLLLSDCDGVLTDNGVYYSAKGEELKKFSIRDGMGVERLKNLVSIETGIITGEGSKAIVKRAEKLKITVLYLLCKNKSSILNEILILKRILPEEIAYIGDDVNDLDLLGLVGFSACPADAMEAVKVTADYICKNKGGNGAFREFAELLISLKQDL